MGITVGYYKYLFFPYLHVKGNILLHCSYLELLYCVIVMLILVLLIQLVFMYDSIPFLLTNIFYRIQNIEFTWSLEADRGLIQPDVVYQLVVDPDVCATRTGYGLCTMSNV
jgi:uncharacterized membrane protein YcgQ (UPF0703/DUF1980 family)